MFYERACRCKKCVILAQQKWIKANAEKHLSNVKKYQSENREKLRVYGERYRKTHKMQFRIYTKEYAARNKEKVALLAKDWIEKNPNASKVRHKKEAELLTEAYVRQLASKQLKCSSELIQPELIEVKRKHLQILRKLKEATNDNR